MVAILLALTLFVRLVAPHEVFTALHGRPLVPILTLIAFLAMALEIFRGNLSARAPVHLALQGLLFLWAAICLKVGGEGSVLSFITSNYAKDLFFIATMILILNSMARFRIIVGTVLVANLIIAAFAAPQTWGDRQCAEWQLGDMANVQFDGRSCQEVNECYINPPRDRSFEGIGERLYRCERRGPFGIAAYVGRIRWVGILGDSNALGGLAALLAPIILAWGWRNSWRSRAIALGSVLCLSTMIFFTGSRGAQLALVCGVGLTAWGLMGRRVVILGAMVTIGVILVLLTVGKLRVREEGRFEGSTSVSDRYRREAMVEGFRVWSEHPLVGVGFKQFTHYHDIGPHNAFLEVASELGTPGLLLFGLIVWINLRGAYSVWRHSRQRRRESADQPTLLHRYAIGMGGANLAALLALTIFLHGYAGFLYMHFSALNAGFVRSVQMDERDYRFALKASDLVLSALTTFMITGAIYVGLMASYSLS